LERAQQALAVGNVGLAYQLLVPALRDDPGNWRAWYQYGGLAEHLRRWGSAAACMVRADRLEPGNAQTLTALGWNLHLSGRTEEAEGSLRGAIDVAPDFGLAHTNLSHVLTTLGRDEEALVEAEMGVDLDPSSGLAHLALSFAYFFNDRWEDGFREFEVRVPLRMPDMAAYPFPRWRGERVGRLLLMREQGLGDTIQMLRYVDEVVRRVGRVVLQVQRELISLCQARFPDAEIEAMPCPLPPRIDAWIPMMSLPNVLPDPGSAPYLQQVWPIRSSRERRVGLVWAGDPTHDNDAHRSIPLSEMLRLMEVPDIAFVSMQVGQRGTAEMDACGAHGLVEDMAPRIFDMRDTRKIIEGLDLVISVDTATAHLAGALGVPVWLMVNQRGCDWRWGHEREDSRLYPKHRIFRRSLHEQWGDVIERVARALEKCAD
jgi:hypothetical protein